MLTRKIVTTSLAALMLAAGASTAFADADGNPEMPEPYIWGSGESSSTSESADESVGVDPFDMDDAS